MSAVRRFLSRLRRLFQKSAQAPQAVLPPRFDEAVQLFRLKYPEATAEQWSAFAQRLASQAYAQGLHRGLDQAAGRPTEWHDWKAGDVLPWLAAALVRRDPRDPFRDVPLDEQHAFVNDLVRAQRAGIQVRLVPDPPKALARPSSRP